MFDPSVDCWLDHIVRLSRFESPDTTDLNELPNRVSLKHGDVARVPDADTGSAADFVFFEGEWIKVNMFHSVADRAGMDSLIISRTADVARVAGTQVADYVFSGKEWMPLNNVHIAADVTQRESLMARSGDVVYVADADGKGNPANFLHSQGEWIEFAKAGHASELVINAERVTIRDDSTISTSTSGHGNAGDIMLKVNRLDIGTGASVVSESSSEIFGGSAGTIMVEAADSVRLDGARALSTDAKGAGGGKIDVTAGNEIYLLNDGISSSVAIGEGKGGDVTAESKFVILNHGDITANADGGDGGAIFIRTENFLKSLDSKVTATSNRGNDGTIKIKSPDIDMSGNLTPVSGNPLNASRWLPKTCAERGPEDRSRFIIKPRDAMPTSPEDLQASPPRPFGSMDQQSEVQK